MSKPVITIRRGRDVDVENVRRAMPHCEIVDRRRNPQWPLDVALLWLALFGIWPADPPHNFDTLAGTVDLVVHLGAWMWLVARWKVERR